MLNDSGTVAIQMSYKIHNLMYFGQITFHEASVNAEFDSISLPCYGRIKLQLSSVRQKHDV